MWKFSYVYCKVTFNATTGFQEKDLIDLGAMLKNWCLIGIEMNHFQIKNQNVYSHNKLVTCLRSMAKSDLTSYSNYCFIFIT